MKSLLFCFYIISSPYFALFHLILLRLLRLLALHLDRLNIPDHLGVLVDTPITREESHPRYTRNRFGQPLLLILVRLIDQLLRIEVALEVIRDEVVIAVIDNGVDEGGELTRIAEHSLADGLEDLVERGVELEVAIEVVVAQVFDIFREVSKEEDVVFADFTSDLEECVSNLRSGQFRRVENSPQYWHRHKYR